MTRTYYADYATHCLRFYFKNEQPDVFKTDADMLNWQAAKTVVETYDEPHRKFFKAIYSSGGKPYEMVPVLANRLDVEEGYIWKELKDLERKVAILRGLL